MLNLSEFSILDIVALALFFVVWIGHFYIVNHSRFRHHTITAAMVTMRERWMLNMVKRDRSPFDALIQNGLQQGVLFFGSTSVLLIGGLVAGLGAGDQAVAVLKELPLSTTRSSFQWEIKILLMIFIFVFAFFKFAWSYRLYNYILIMIGAAPHQDEEEEVLKQYAKKLSLLHALAAMHFTTGLNSYFFALSAFTWFLNAWLFIVSTLWVALVLYRRAFRSNFLVIFKTKVHPLSPD
ncbi:DUF599 domain-containing protein [Granulosicoccus antarcticus]|uniref:DUF599 domain-containing protein n=1 Tax=Granulosicoccus antarcticus IMCC3135 TaxID=1192854 RepID=A0A2Z2P4X3_9GAMM|nr:DUF599 family protein [Granulosicoccus antarcticus]ASJ76520.1 hypothetical protein IMCC3135_32375 [Granulosicoccus antarcticus IMCC3135]